jgi:hypothetical protein
MSVESAKQDIKGSYGDGFVIMGGDRVEVSQDGKQVTAYAKDGIETKAASGEGSAQGISISADFNTVVLNGVTIQRAADGHLVISAPGGTVKQAAPANDGLFPSIASSDVSRLLPATKAVLKIGEKMPDGTVYAGISPDTGKAMYTTPADAPLTYTFNQSQKYAGKLDAHGHKDWRVPTKGELNVLFQNRADIGGFDISGSNPAGWYWSSSQTSYTGAWAQRFSDGYQGYNYTLGVSSLRCVR